LRLTGTQVKLGEDLMEGKLNNFGWTINGERIDEFNPLRMGGVSKKAQQECETGNSSRREEHALPELRTLLAGN